MTGSALDCCLRFGDNEIVSGGRWLCFGLRRPTKACWGLLILSPRLSGNCFAGYRHSGHAGAGAEMRPDATCREDRERFFMIGRCFNPECGEELRYLRNGSVYAWESGSAHEIHVEFFWLCPTCSCTFQIACDENGRPVLEPGLRKLGFDRQGFRVRRVLVEVSQTRAA